MSDAVEVRREAAGGTGMTEIHWKSYANQLMVERNTLREALERVFRTDNARVAKSLAETALNTPVTVRRNYRLD